MAFGRYWGKGGEEGNSLRPMQFRGPPPKGKNVCVSHQFSCHSTKSQGKKRRERKKEFLGVIPMEQFHSASGPVGTHPRQDPRDLPGCEAHDNTLSSRFLC